MFVFLFATTQEAEKFEQLYEKYKNLMLYKAHEILHDYALAEDAASEAFIRVYKNLHKLGPVESPKTAAFLVTIVRNVALTMYGKEKHHTAAELDETLPDDSDIGAEVAARLAAEDMVRLLERLNEELRSTFLLKYAHDMTHREIAALLHITENNVTVRLHRARQKIAALLREEGYV